MPRQISRDRRGGRAAVVAGAMLAVAASCSPSTPPPAAPSGQAVGPTASAWPTYHADVSRSGFVGGQPLGAVKPAWTSPTLDGDVYAEPLVFHGDVFVATESNSVYALDASSGDVVWRRNLGTPVDSSTLPCGNIEPTSGITATPAIDPSTGRIFVAAFLTPARHELFAIDARSGEVDWHRSIDAPGMDPIEQQLRAALLFANDRVYAAYGGLFGDCGEYHGWVVGVSAGGNGEAIDYRVPTANKGGIWAPSGPAANEAGDVYVATGNSTSDAFDLGDSVIELSPSLKRLDYFAPSNWADLNAGDVDLGSVGPAVLADDAVFQIGKGGVGYLLDGTDLGGIGGARFSAHVCAGSFGGTAHTSDMIFVPCTDGLVALALGEGGSRFSVRWRSDGFSAGPPIVAGGLVWTVDLTSSALVGLHPATGAEVVRFGLHDVSHFASPSAGLGCIYVPTLRSITGFCLDAR